MKKRLLSMLLVVILMVLSMDITAFATGNVVTSHSLETAREETLDLEALEIEADTPMPLAISTGGGTIETSQGEITWEIDQEGTLTVEGEGDVATDNKGGTLIPWSGKNFTSAVISVEGITDLSYFFADCKYLRTVDFTGTDTGNVTDMSYMFNDCWQLHEVDLSGFDTADVTSLQGMFSGCKNLRKIIWNKEKFDTGNVTNMNSMFLGCIHLNSVDLSGFKTGKVTDMSAMFKDCAKLTEVNLSSFNTQEVTTMAYMFSGNTSMKNLDLSAFRTENVTTMAEMFKGSSDLQSLNMSSFDTSKVTDMSSMFEGLSSLKELDLSSFDMSGVTKTGTFLGGEDFWGKNITALEKIRSPKNLTQTVSLPKEASETWHLQDGSMVTELPKSSSESKVIQKNKPPKAGVTLNVSDTSKRPVIIIAFDEEPDLKSFSLKLDEKEVLSTTGWRGYYSQTGKEVRWQPGYDLTAGSHTVSLEVEDTAGEKLGTPITTTFTVAEEGQQPGETPEELIDKVVVVVNSNYIRVRAWSSHKDIRKISAEVAATYPQEGMLSALSGEDTLKETYEMSMTNGYYTCLIPRDREGLSKVEVTVTAENAAGKSYTTEKVEVSVDDALEDDKVVNDLWVKFLDGQGSEYKEYSYTGKAIKPEVEVYEGTSLLVLNKDYSISYKDNKNAGTGKVVVKGKGSYNKSAEAEFTILPKMLDNDDVYETVNRITIDAMAAVEKNKVQKLVPVIKYGTMKLKNNRDFTVSYPDTQSGAYQKSGEWEVVVQGTGNYDGEVSLNYSIGGKLAKKLKVSKIEAQPYTGGEVCPAVTVSDGKTTLTEAKNGQDGDYTVTYRNNIQAGTASVVITGVAPGYVGEKVVNFKIKGIAIKKAAAALPKSLEYTGEALRPELGLVYNNEPLQEGRDYKAVYSKNKTAGTASIQITGQGAYTGTMKKTFKITPFDAVNNTEGRLTVEIEEKLPYAKGGAKPVPVISFGQTLLREGVDYKLSYSGNKKVGTGTAKIKFLKNYKGTLSKPFAIETKDISLLESMTQDVAAGMKKNKWKSKVVVVDLDGKKLVQNTDYEKVTTYYEDQECTKAATAETYPQGTTLWFKVSAKGNYHGELVASFEVKPAVISKAKVKIEAQPYTANPVTLDYEDITYVRVGNKTLVPGTDYVIDEDSYRNNVKKGKAEVTLRGRGEYGGSITVKFTIGPKFFLWRWFPSLDPVNKY